MGYYWVTLNDGFNINDHTTPIYGIRLRPASTESDLCSFLSEKQGFDYAVGGIGWDQGLTEEVGYYSHHSFQNWDRWWSECEYFTLKNGSRTNRWNEMEVVTIDGVEWHQDTTMSYYHPPLYWAGFINPQNWADANCYDTVQFMLKVPFEPSKYSFTFEITGGSESFTVEAETGWTASSPTFATLSTLTGDTGVTTLTVSVPNYTGDTKRTEIITFTDANGETFNIRVTQKGLLGSSSLYIGTENISSIYLCETQLGKICLGDTTVFDY